MTFLFFLLFNCRKIRFLLLPISNPRSVPLHITKYSNNCFQILRQQPGQPPNIVRASMLTMKGNVPQIPMQQQALQQPQQVTQQVMQSPRQSPQAGIAGHQQQIINAALLPNAAGGQSVTVWQRHGDPSK